MIVCICRNIRDSDYSTTQDLMQRIFEKDHQCGQCQKYLQNIEQCELDNSLQK